MLVKVYSECCKNCLLSEDSIVSPERRKDLIDECKKKQKYFICHKASMKGEEEIICHKFYKELGQHSQAIRLAERLKMVGFVPQEDTERLPSYNDINR